MAVTSALFDCSLQTLLAGEWKWTTSIYVFLTTVTYVPTKATDNYLNDVTNEVVGAGYTTGGQAIASPTISAPAIKIVTVDCADVAWAASTITARVAIFYYNNAGATSTEPVVVYVNFGADVVSTVGTFTIQLAAGGLFTLTNGDAV